MSDLDKLGGLLPANPAVTAIHHALLHRPGNVLDAVLRPPDGIVLHLDDGTKWLIVAYVSAPYYEEVQP